MNHSRRHVLVFKIAALVAVLLAVASVISTWLQWPQDRESALLTIAKPPSRPLFAHNWHAPALDKDYARLFSPLGEQSSPQRPDREGIGMRYRLAGVMMHAAAPEKSTAFIEEKSSGKQRRLRVGNELEPDYIVRSIASKEVWIIGPDGEECLVQEGHTASREATPTAAVSKTSEHSTAAKGRQRFGGRQTGTNSWMFSREAIMGYYQELLDRPERLVKVFDSLAPVYTEERKIEGYRVNIEGEADFFEAVGLNQGDIVHSVNSIEMTNRRRAENLIRRFTQDDLDLVIIELERDGKRIKQFYDTK